MRSERLPGKVLLKVLGRPLLELMIERLQRCELVDDIVIATTDDVSCDPLAELCGRLDVGCYRGSEVDVLDRVLRAGRWASADLIVETTGDCPLIDHPTVDRVVATFLGHDVDYCSNMLEDSYPRGTDVQVFPLAVLEEVARLTDDPVDHEHVSLYIYEHPQRFRLLGVKSALAPEDAALRLTVDTEEDFRLVREIYEELYPQKPEFTLDDIAELIHRRPELREINKGIRQKAPR